MLHIVWSYVFWISSKMVQKLANSSWNINMLTKVITSPPSFTIYNLKGNIISLSGLIKSLESVTQRLNELTRNNFEWVLRHPYSVSQHRLQRNHCVSSTEEELRKLFKGYEHPRPINRVTRNTRKLFFKKIER